jgi:hypothetical protein
MVQIQPLTIAIKGIATQMNVLVLNFATNATTAVTYWQLFNDKNECLLDGNYTLTEQEFATWGQDNTFVNECVAESIGVIIIE